MCSNESGYLLVAAGCAPDGFEAVWGMTLRKTVAAVIEVAAALDTGDGATDAAEDASSRQPHS